MGDGVWQPQPIIADASANALARMREPPVLNIALRELPRGGAQQMLPDQTALRYGQRHHVLKLIPKAVSTACLIKCGSGQDPARQGLVEQPTVEQDVHGTIGGFNRDDAQSFIPMFRYRTQDRVEVRGPIA